MFGIGMPEMILILIVALVVVGPKKLPEFAKSMGNAIKEFKKEASSLKENLQLDKEIGSKYNRVGPFFNHAENDIDSKTKSNSEFKSDPNIKK